MRVESWWSDRPVIHVVRNTDPPIDPGAPPPPPVPTEVGVGTPPVTNTLFDNWTPADRRAHQTIEVYSNCAEVEAFLNGRSLGRKPLPGSASPRQWGVAFEAGEVRATCISDGAVAGQDVLHTAGAPARIELSVENGGPLGSDWDALAFVRARIVDAQGVTVPNAGTMIRFSVSRSGVLVVTDNNDATDHTPFASAQRRTFEGRALALVRGVPGSEPGSDITVTATASGLKAGSIRIPAARER
jgi:beta-galactosidase